MKKKSLILLLLGIVLVSVAIIAFSLSKKTETKNQTDTETSSSAVLSIHRYPSLAKIKACHGKDIQVLGKTQITTVLFKNKNVAILTPEKGKSIQLKIELTDKKKNLFKIPDLSYSSNKLKIGDQFGLAQKGTNYFAYDLNSN